MVCLRLSCGDCDYSLVVTRAAKVAELVVFVVIAVLVVAGTAKVDEALVLLFIVTVLVVAGAAVGDGAAGSGGSHDSHCE